MSQEIEKLIQAVDDRLDEIDRKLTAHMQETDRRIDDIMDAFVGRDIHGHKRYHELQMEILEEKRRLRMAIQEKTISGLIWSTILFIAGAIIAAIKNGYFFK